MPSSAKISFISTPFSHSVTFTSTSGLSDNITFIRESLNISSLVADFIGPLPRGTFQNAKKALRENQANDNRVEKEVFQVGFEQNLLEEIFESVHVCSIAKDVLQTDVKGRNGNKLKRKLLLSKVLELVDSKTTQNIRIHECDLMARVVLQSKDRITQNQLYIIYSFIMRSCPLFNIPFQSEEHFNNLYEFFSNHLHKTSFLKEHQLWHSNDASLQLIDQTKDQMELKSKISQDRQVFDQNKSKDYFDDNLADDKCSTASRSSITTHERNFEINDIDSGNFLEFNLRFSEIQSPPRYSEFFACSAYDGFVVGDLEINFTPADNLLSCFEEDKPTHPQGQNNSKNKTISSQAKSKKKDIPGLQTAGQGQLPNNQKVLEFKLFTLPNFNFDPRFSVAEQNNKNNHPQPKSKTNGRNAENSKKPKETSSSSSSNTKTKNTQNQKPKAKKPQDKSIKLWDMISVNGKLKKN